MPSPKAHQYPKEQDGSIQGTQQRSKTAAKQLEAMEEAD
jgi:hypothetical protein